MTSDRDRDGQGDPHAQDEQDDSPTVGGTPHEVDVDAAFAALVAQFSEPVPDGIGRWPAAEDVDEAVTPTPPLDPPAQTLLPGRGQLEPPAEPDAVGMLGRTDREAPEDEGRFIPPEPPPLHGDLISRLAWGAVIGGPLFLLIAAMVWQGLPTMLLLLAIVAFIGGFVTLVARMPGEPPDDPDDGAVV